MIGELAEKPLLILNQHSFTLVLSAWNDIKSGLLVSHLVEASEVCTWTW